VDAPRGRRTAPGAGPIGVIVPERERDSVTRELDEAGIGWSAELQMATAPAAARVVVLGATDAKGLEFDDVIVVEPGEVAGESSQGLRALFVALTRTTNRLSIVHAEPLPSLLEVDSSLSVQRSSPSPPAAAHGQSPWEPVAPAVVDAPRTPPNGVSPVRTPEDGVACPPPPWRLLEAAHPSWRDRSAPHHRPLGSRTTIDTVTCQLSR
jgi:hypothetical protein